MIPIALVGPGDIGIVHAQAVVEHSELQLAAVVGNQPIAPSNPVFQDIPYYNDIGRMLREINPSGAIIATPTHLHVTQAIQCIRSGVSVLVEKPIATDVNDAMKIGLEAKKNRVAVLVGHHRRFNKRMVIAQALLRSGAIGKLVAVSMVWLVRKPEAYFRKEWRTRSGAGILFNNLIHEIDSIRFLCGEIRSASGYISSANRELNVPDSTVIILQLESGALVSITASDTTPSPCAWEVSVSETKAFPKSGQDCWIFAGTEGTLSFPSLTIWKHEAAGDWQSRLRYEKVKCPKNYPIYDQLDHFKDVIRGVDEPRCSVHDATQTLRTIKELVHD